MSEVKNNSVDLIVTSPPYPMIEMWDEMMALQNPEIAACLQANKGRKAFILMHAELDKVWTECNRVLKSGGFLCINIGDATRTINGNFELFSNHAQVIQSCTSLGLTNLPCIIWRKQTNAPNKFMGSGMLPCGAYVTLEHEWILIFRKGGKRLYKTEGEKQKRRESAYFWEERNAWFSDLWSVKGVRQQMQNKNSRERSASFPLTIPYRLINMFSQKDDLVLDPFLGLATTTEAAIMLKRNSIGYEIDAGLRQAIKDRISSLSCTEINSVIKSRLEKHRLFVEQRKKNGKMAKYENSVMNCEVITAQEKEMDFDFLEEIGLGYTMQELIVSCTYYPYSLRTEIA